MKCFGDIKIRLTVRGICLFEQMADKSFFDMTDDDLFRFMYCTIIASNEFNYTYDTFLSMCKNKKVTDFLVTEYEKMFKMLGQFNKEAKSENSESGETDNVKISTYVSALIVDMGLDAEYVYDRMQLWEIEMYFKRWEDKEKQRLQEQRIWTYLTMVPHLDPKKKVTPEDILPFEWEKDNKKNRVLRDLEDKSDLIKAVLGIKPTSAENQTLKEKE